MASRNGPILRLKGLKGFFEGEERMLRRGDEIVVGRSRGAGLSLRMASKFLARPDRNEIRDSEAYRSVSRRHVRIAYYRPDHVVVEDLSANGTYIDGERVEGKRSLSDLAQRPHLLGLGSVERLRLDLIR
jgi:pSer/pThr/pTyr-binding forkhead associated (FHA) protein